MKGDSTGLNPRQRNRVAMGLIIGAAIGAFVFIYTRQAMYIGVGAGLGIVAGAMAARE